MREDHLSLHSSGCKAVSDASISADQPKRVAVFNHIPILFFCWLAAAIHIMMDVLPLGIIPHNNFEESNARKEAFAICQNLTASDRRSHI